MSIEELAEVSAAMVPEGSGRAILGIAGTPGAGKSTLADLLVGTLARSHGAEWVAHLPMDGYHLADVQLERLHALRRKGAPDTFDAEGYAHMLTRIRTEPSSWIYAPGFDRDLEQPLAGAVVIPPSARLVISEGNYLLLDGVWARARSQMDEVWYVAVDEDVRLERLVSRHVAFGKRPHAARTWVEKSDQPNAVLVAPSIERADRIVVNGPDGWTFAPARSAEPPVTAG